MADEAPGRTEQGDAAPVVPYVEPVDGSGTSNDAESGDQRDERELVPAGEQAHLEHDEQAPPDQPVRDGSSAVIRVGEDDDRDSDEARRRGWWQRFLS